MAHVHLPKPGLRSPAVAEEKHPGPALVLALLVGFCLSEGTIIASGTSETRKWFEGLDNTFSSAFEVVFRRNIPQVDTNSYTLDSRVVGISWTTQDWFHGIYTARQRFLVGNSLKPNAEVADAWPFYRDFRWVVGCDSTNLWFVNNGTELSFGPILSNRALATINQAGLPPPQKFSLGLYSVVHEVLTLGLGELDHNSFRWNGETFAGMDIQGREISGGVQISKAGVERIYYGGKETPPRFVDLIWHDAATNPSLPRTIRCSFTKNGVEEVRATYEVLRFGRSSEADWQYFTPPLLAHARAGVALEYSGQKAARFVVSPQGELLAIGVTDSTSHGARKSARDVVRLCLVLLIVAPFCYALWSYVKTNRSDSLQH